MSMGLRCVQDEDKDDIYKVVDLKACGSGRVLFKSVAYCGVPHGRVTHLSGSARTKAGLQSFLVRTYVPSRCESWAGGHAAELSGADCWSLRTLQWVSQRVVGDGPFGLHKDSVN